MTSYSPILSVVVPTLNEAENVALLVKRLESHLESVAYEVIFCDDASSDGTPEAVELLMEQHGHVRLLRRTQNHGLAASLIDGFALARGEYVGVLDADLQHDESIIPEMIRRLSAGSYVAVGSRYTPTGSASGWSFVREAQSRLAASVSRHTLRIGVKDPLSGFFVMRRSVWRSIAPGVRARGWKLLLEVLALLDESHVVEVPFTFSCRNAGESKIGSHVVLSWIRQLAGLRRERRARLAAGKVMPRPALILAGAHR